MLLSESDLKKLSSGLQPPDNNFSGLMPMSMEEENDWTRQLILHLEKMEETRVPFHPFPPLPARKRLLYR